MIYYSTTLLMVSVFLIFTLLVGLCATKKAITFREYAVGNKSFHTNTLVFTTLATIIGGGVMMFYIPRFYDRGIFYTISLIISYVIRYAMLSLLGLRMGPFMQHLSIAETIGSIYGKYPRLIVACLSICWMIVVVSVQINVMSSIIAMCIDSIDPRIFTMLATLILIIYATFGGIRAVTVTDVWQFITFTIMIPLLIKFVFIKTGKSFLEDFLFLQKHEKYRLSHFFEVDSNTQNSSLLLKFLSLAFFIPPPIIHKAYMHASPIQIRKVFLYVSLIIPLILLFISMISLFVFVGDPNLPEKAIWPYILADMPPVYKGCLMISVLGMTMSTADSNLHTASIMFSHDVVQIIRGIKRDPYIDQLRIAKLTGLFTGLLSMILTLYYLNLFELVNCVLQPLTLGMTTIVSPPFILAVFGFRGTPCTALVGMATGIVVTCGWYNWVESAIALYGVLWGILANGLAMMAAHYWLKQPKGQGWVGLDPQQKRIQQLIRAFKRYKKRLDLE
ncbi:MULTISPECIES: sodium:solute symporter family protein [Candidatus Cardinium]|uniref:sodium:solute symporter family protein n=1 Tax=Candidatus Cardinium TaxID=273135 RepID=UPI001FA96E5F|nr:MULTISPECIES: sodium:solute symporter family protein [Cardinium]